MGWFNSAPKIMYTADPDSFDPNRATDGDTSIVFVWRENGYEERDPRNNGWFRNDAAINVYGTGSFAQMEKLMEQVYEHAWEDDGAFTHLATEQQIHIILASYNGNMGVVPSKSIDLHHSHYYGYETKNEVTYSEYMNGEAIHTMPMN